MQEVLSVFGSQGEVEFFLVLYDIEGVFIRANRDSSLLSLDIVRGGFQLD